MEQTAAEVFSKVRSAVADVRTGLVRFERMLDSFESGKGQVSRGYLDLISTLMTRGSVDVWYHGEYIAVPFHRLPNGFEIQLSSRPSITGSTRLRFDGGSTMSSMVAAA